MEHDTTLADAAAEISHDPAEHVEHHPQWSTYWKVALILGIITAAEVGMYYSPAIVASRAFVPGLLVLSALKLSSADAIYRSTAGGITHILVATSEPIDKLDLDLGRVAAVSRACRGLTLVPFRKVDGAMLQARVFAPAVGVPEDPGSGSAAGPIALLARELWGTETEVTITMGTEIGRPSRIDVQTADELRVGGRVALCAEGQFLV